MLTKNPMLVFSIYEGLTEGDAQDLRPTLINVAVHCWYEGHVEGEDNRPRLGAVLHAAVQPPVDDAEPCPSPPFPRQGDPQLYAIVEEAAKRFPDPDHSPAAVAYAASLAWAQGHAEGRLCPGCRCRGTGDVAFAALVRTGKVPITLCSELPKSPRQRPRRSRARRSGPLQ